jgi:DNA-binding NtrC family response regulator
MNFCEKCPPDCVLAIDDEPELLDIVKDALENDGFAVHTFSTPEDAIKLYESKWREIKVVVSDFRMPGMTGDALLDQLREINPDVRAILMTAYYGERALRSMFDYKLHGCLEKPFYLEELTQRVREATAD